MNKFRNSSNDNGEKSTENQPPGMPRWLKVSGIIAIVFVLLFVIMHLFSGGKMGPGSHMPGGASAGQIKQEVVGEQKPPRGGY
ncbi:hypothetical protein [Gracilibacillus sp. YIM 98692]|uniref:hypothetical protein n=1 Tax=Gracilibacillus sp. YIM 98692 TaxID=2663532 RepID=UPI0013D68445|nr:hypothetical protein [Gracilibacillus sp. YIM 98692]